MSLIKVSILNQADSRGEFRKYFSEDILASIPDFGRPVEMYSSSSHSGVIRGLHFQHGQNKLTRLVWVSSGEIDDVAVDLRKGDSYGQIHRTHLRDSEHVLIYIPWYFAHGFQVLSENATVNYLTNRPYSPKDEAGFHYDSFGMTWTSKPTEVSKRDLGLPPFSEIDALSYE